MASDRSADYKMIRRKLNRAYSSMVVYGMGCDTQYIDTFLDDPYLGDLYRDNDEAKYNKWGELLKSGEHKENHFLSSYFEELSSAPSFSFAHCYVLKTSIADTLPKNNRKRVTALELNGNIKEATNASGKIVKVSELDRDVHKPLFPNSQYDSKRKAVKLLESAYTNDMINIALFVGSSGYCPVTESLYNLALVNKSFIVVVNPDPNCFMHDLADISLKMKAEDFFEELAAQFGEDSEHYR